MYVLGLFDGVSCAQVALLRAEKKVDKYFASEVDDRAITTTLKHFPNTIQLGDVNGWRGWDLPKIDLLCAGFPCQSFSFVGKKDGFKSEKGSLLHKALEVMEHYRPEYFFFENVKMPKKYSDVITRLLGVEPILINSGCVSAQSRERVYWTNIPKPNFTDNEASKSLLSDIVVSNAKSLQKTYEDNRVTWESGQYGRIGFIDGKNKPYTRIYDIDRKSKCVCANGGGQGAICGLYKIEGKVRKLSPLECERLQTLPDNFTEGFADYHRYRLIGNAWTVDVVAEFFKNIK